MMRVNRYVWLCEDCIHPAVNDDYSGIDATTRAREEQLCALIKRGLRKLGQHLVPAFASEDDHEDTTNPDVDTDFTEPCDCCGRAGLRFRRGYRFAVLTPASKRYAAVHAEVKAALAYMDGCALDDENERRRVLDEIMERLHAAKLA